MPEYLSKEEVKQWRSSLEKITLEEFAARLGKVIEEEKQTNDLVDIVLNGSPVVSRQDSNLSITKNEKINAIAQRSFDREREISHSPFAANVNSKKQNVKIAEKKEKFVEKAVAKKTEAASIKNSSEITFSKALTEREQLVFDFFAKNKNQIVYAKDLAKLLDLPRDYVYKYIKNLRAKIEGDKLQNSDNGGYVLAL